MAREYENVPHRAVEITPTVLNAMYTVHASEDNGLARRTNALRSVQ